MKKNNVRKNNVRTMVFIGLDGLDCPVYKCLETGQLWKDLSLDEHPQLHSCGCLDDDPGWAIRPDLEIRFKTKYKF
jgi:hypothetical protein